MVELLHAKNVYLKLNVGFSYGFTLFTKSFNVDISNKSTTIAQKGEYIQTPFNKMPIASASFITYVRSEEDLSLLLQLGYEMMTSSIKVIRHSILDENQVEDDQPINYKTIFEGIGIIESVNVTGRAGNFITVRITMNLEEYRHSQSNVSSQLLH